MLHDSLKRFRHMPKDTIIWLKCNTVSTQTSLYRYFFSRVSRNVNNCRIFSKDLVYKYIFFETALLYLTLLLSLCLERVFAFFHEYCTEM